MLGNIGFRVQSEFSFQFNLFFHPSPFFSCRKEFFPSLALSSKYYLGNIHHTPVVCLCGRATKQWFTFCSRDYFLFFLLCFHISKMQPDVGWVRHEVGPDLTPTGMLEGSVQFSRKKGGKNSFSMWAKKFYCCELPVNQEITECWSYCWGFKKLPIQPSSSFWSRPLYPELVTSCVTGTM